MAIEIIQFEAQTDGEDSVGFAMNSVFRTALIRLDEEVLYHADVLVPQTVLDEDTILPDYDSEDELVPQKLLVGCDSSDVGLIFSMGHDALQAKVAEAKANNRIAHLGAPLMILSSPIMFHLPLDPARNAEGTVFVKYTPED